MRYMIPTSLLVFGVLVVACAGSGTRATTPREPRIRSCADIAVVREHWDRIALRASDAFGSRFEAPAKEKVTLRLALNSNGSVRSLEVRSATSLAAEEMALAAVREAAPFPQPPLRYLTCFSKPNPLLLIVDLRIQCHQRDAYHDYISRAEREVAREAQRLANMEGPGEGNVVFRVKVGEDGDLLDIEELAAPSLVAAAKGERALRAASLPDPPEPLSCFRDDWVRLGFMVFSKE